MQNKKEFYVNFLTLSLGITNEEINDCLHHWVPDNLCMCAHETQQPTLIYEAIEQHIAKELSNNSRASTDVKSTIGPIDNRICLQTCEAPLNTMTEFGNAN